VDQPLGVCCWVTTTWCNRWWEGRGKRKRSAPEDAGGLIGLARGRASDKPETCLRLRGDPVVFAQPKHRRTSFEKGWQHSEDDTALTHSMARRFSPSAAAGKPTRRQGRADDVRPQQRRVAESLHSVSTGSESRRHSGGGRDKPRTDASGPFRTWTIHRLEV
jgi:hypothetical protein